MLTLKHLALSAVALSLLASSALAVSDTDERFRAKYGRYPQAGQAKEVDTCHMKCCLPKCCER